MATAVDDEEQSPLNSAPLDERTLDVVRNAKQDDDGRRTVRPALLASELGLSVEEATRELCGLLSAVGGGEDGASFAFERVRMPPTRDEGPSSALNNAEATTMVFTFPADFDVRAKRFRRQSDLRQRLHSLATGLVKGIKIFTAFGLIISLAVLIIAGICLLIVAVIALARGGGHGGGGHRHHPLMHRLRYLFLQLRTILWLYAICGSGVDGQQDPFMREVAGDLALMLSLCCGNPMHPYFWLRAGGMRRRWARVGQRSRGWGGNSTWNNWSDDNNIDGIAMVRRGSWGEEQRSGNSHSPSSFDSSDDEQQRGLLSIAVEFLFGPNDPPAGNGNNLPSVNELEKWKFRASIIMTLSSTSPGNGISLRDLLPYVDIPPVSAEDPSALRETLTIVSYFNGKPVDCGSETDNNPLSGMDARFCFPEIVAEMDCTKLVDLSSSEFSPHARGRSNHVTSILYKEESHHFGSSANASADVPEYLYERPIVLTELTQQQFGQCALLGLLNLVGVALVLNATMPGGLLELPVSAAARSRSGSGPLINVAALLVLKLLHILQFYAGLFFFLPLCRLLIVLMRNNGVERRNKMRSDFVRAEL